MHAKHQLYYLVKQMKIIVFQHVLKNYHIYHKKVIAHKIVQIIHIYKMIYVVVHVKAQNIFLMLESVFLNVLIIKFYNIKLINMQNTHVQTNVKKNNIQLKIMLICFQYQWKICVLIGVKINMNCLTFKLNKCQANVQKNVIQKYFINIVIGVLIQIRIQILQNS